MRSRRYIERDQGVIEMGNTSEKSYTPKEIRLSLNTSSSNLSKWCLNLEKNGYKFLRNSKNHRVFDENDLLALKHLQNLVDHQKMRIEDAAIMVVDRFGESTLEEGTDIVSAENEEKQPEIQSDIMESIEEVMPALLEHLKMQEKVNRELYSRLDEQEYSNQLLIKEVKSLNERLETMGRDRELMTALRESQEIKQQVLLEIAAADEEKKTGFIATFKRLFAKERII